MKASRKRTARHKLLRIYLNDHLVGLVVGIAMAERCLSNNAGTSLGSFLKELLPELRKDHASLKKVMTAVPARTDPIKLVGAKVGERIGRLKLNGRLVGYSDLSRLTELETLYITVDHKLKLWRSLQHVSGDHPGLADFEFPALIHRASSQLADLERHRLDAVERAFT